MIIDTVVPLNLVDALPARQVGKVALDFARLLKLKIKTSDGFVLPSETQKQIAHHNDLFSKIKIVEDTADWESDFAIKTNLKKIRSLITKQKIPGDIASQIVKKAEKLANKNTFFQIQTDTNILENIQGTANVLESILDVWATSYNRGENLTPPILVLTQTQPDISGVASIDKERKNIVQIKVVGGVYDRQLGPTVQPDLFEINLTSMTVVSRHINPRKVLLKRQLDNLKTTKIKPNNQAAITDDQALKIATSCQLINRQALGRRKLFFEIMGGKIIVSKLYIPSVKTSTDTELLLVGQSVTSGYIEGFVQIVETPADARNFITGNILVKKSLDHLDHDLVLKASAIVLEDKSLSPAMTKLIHDHHVPCVVGASDATSRLHHNQKVIVDAGGGKLLKPNIIAKPAIETRTLTKVILSAGNPHKLEQYPVKTEGIFLKSDYAIAFLGVHPNHLLRTQKHQLPDTLSRTVKVFLERSPEQFFYRACNLNSHELGTLTNSANYEKQESNPYLGTRGALRILEDQSLFATELQVTNHLASQTKKNINFVLPWVRTSAELAILFKKIEQIVPEHPYLKFWLQLNTPANVFNLNEFLHLPIAGITIQAKTIHDLTYGFDPDSPELERSYSFDTRLMTSMVQNIVKVIKQSKLYTGQVDRTLPIILKLNHYQSEMVSLATQLGLRAVVVKPSLFAIVKQQIIATQNQFLK